MLAKLSHSNECGRQVHVIHVYVDDAGRNH